METIAGHDRRILAFQEAAGKTWLALCLPQEGLSGSLRFLFIAVI